MAAAAAAPPHKANYIQFIDPDYERVAEVNGGEIAQQFQAFANELMARLPDAGTPADGYMYGAHMGAYVRSLDEAKDHFVKAMLAFYAKRNHLKRPAKE